MSATLCGWCGYSRAVPVAGCDHATVPTAGKAKAYCGQAAHSGIGPHARQPNCIGWNGEGGPRVVRATKVPAKATSWDLLYDLVEAGHLLSEDQASDLLYEAECARDALATEREKGNLLAAELVDLQRKLVATEDELEQERRESGRLRADLEMAQQLLSEAEQRNAKLNATADRMCAELDRLASERGGGA